MAPNVSGKTHVSFLFFLFPAKAHFFGVNNDHKIARVHMGSEDGFAFAAQQVCSFHRDPAQHLILGVDQPPFAGNLAGFGGKSFHTEEKSTETTNAWRLCQLARLATPASYATRISHDRTFPFNPKNRNQSAPGPGFPGMVSAGDSGR